MKLNFSLDETNKNWLLPYIILYFSLIISLIFGEDSTGGAILDYTNQKQISIDFSKEFYGTFFNFDNYATRHSPILIIFLSIFEKLNLSDLLIRFIHLNLCLFLPLYFFKSLDLIIKNKQISFFLVSLVFISPTFRSLAIWPDSRLLGLTFFTISIYEYLKFNQNRKFSHCIKNILFLSLAAYFSPNFAVFSIFYFYKFILYYKNRFKFITYIILLNLILSLPAFLYLSSLETNFLLKTAATNLNDESNYLFNNLSNKILLISSIIFFYILPFYILRIFKFNIFSNLYKSILIPVTFFILGVCYFDYQFNFTGGGIFFKASYYFFKNNLVFYLICFFSIILCFNLSNYKFDNLLILLLLILSNPQLTIYHKYYDPLLIILFFTLFNNNISIQKLNKFKNQVIVFLYFFIFLIVSNLKSYVL
tara:strand:- start:10910 stop:12172 length:1263 start_codon:yes stop_codon:yes gene_type:complete